MRNRIIRLICAALVSLFIPLMPVSAPAEGLQACHKVTNTCKETKQENGSTVKLWQISTVRDDVNDELNAIAQTWADEIAPTLPSVNKKKKQSRSILDVGIRYSRTGLTWMSFMVQARTTHDAQTTDQIFTTRTYNMETGERILLTDIFDDADEAWDLLADKVREGIESYWPDETPDTDELALLCSREELERAEFTLHGMSLVLHYPAYLLYKGKYTLIEIPLYYPDIRGLMTEQAYHETDNLSYYRTCALTFDDGPSQANSPKVLDALMETGAVATFFVIGNQIEKAPYIVQREHDQGHAVASHNWHHGSANASAASALKAMPAKVNKVMIKTIGIPVRYDRVPGGRYPPMQKAKVGWAYIQWSLDTYDWRGRTAAQVLKKLRKHLQDGDIILCHDFKDNTPENTRQAVRYMEEQGYLLLTVDELFAKDGVKLEPDKVYFHCVDGDYSIRKDGT